MTFTTLGLRGEQIVTLGEMKATLRGMAGWRHAINGTVPEVVFAFSDGDNFTIAGVPLAKDSASIEAGWILTSHPASRWDCLTRDSILLLHGTMFSTQISK